MEESTPTRPRSTIARIFLSADERRLRSGWRILGQLFLLFIFFIIFGVLFGIIYLILNIPLAASALVIGELVLFSSVTLSVYLARRLLDRRTFVSLGLSLDSLAIRDLLFGILLAGLMMGLIYLVEWALGWLTFDGYAWQEGGISQLLISMAAVFLVFIIVGWQEELLSRGYWLQNMEEGLNLFWAVLLSSSFFALAHLGNPNSSWIAILGLVLAGVFLAFGYLRTRQLWLPIGLHIGWNFFEGPVFGFPVSGLTDMPRLLIHTVNGPEIVTGGAFGPEAGLVIIPAMVLGALVIYWYTRGRLADSPSYTDTQS
jgi:membrane protease YdiL (CAAX protease family)